jgi:septal ring factor EnvC (AmiA/AmiB activator)
MPPRAGRLLLPVLLLFCLLPAHAPAQGAPQDLTQSRRRLQEIREERTQLRRELQQLRSQVRDASDEMQNLRRQMSTSESLLHELDFQLSRTEEEIQNTTRELLATQDRLAERRALLHRRLRDLYKRGALYPVQALLTAESFADLINRYRYLYLVARHDRALMEEVAELERELALRERQLRRDLNDVQHLRGERLTEHAGLQELEGEQRETLSILRRQERSTTGRMEQLARDERRLTGLIAELERRRKEAERRTAASRSEATRARKPAPRTSTAASGESRLSTRDLGALGWPVEGRLLYRFGRITTSSGTQLRSNGVGIGAPVGTPVRSVQAGTVVLARPFEGYGPTVILSHGGGYYSLYLHLEQVEVAEGAELSRGQVVGTVGGQGTPEGPHLEFQIRAPGGRAVDPLAWLRSR